MAGFFYGFGNTLIHFALLVASLFVERPDENKIKMFDQNYFQELESKLDPSSTSNDRPEAFRLDLASFRELEEKHLNICMG